MAFIETRFPDDISYGAKGGPGFQTDVVVVDSGYEQRKAIWQDARGMWDVSFGCRTAAQLATVIAFFRVMGGRANGFRFKDWQDYSAAATEGLQGTGVGTGLPTYQMWKRYTVAGINSDRKITKPVSGSCTFYRGGTPLVVGAGAGQIAIDYTTGVVTFVADASSAASAVTPGATTSVSLAANPGTLTGGQLLYLSGFTGADAALLNGLAHTINSVSGSGPYVFVLATNTAGKTITVGAGVGKKYPQASEALTWAGQFDVPARFDLDQMRSGILAMGLHNWEQIPVIEIRV